MNEYDTPLYNIWRPPSTMHPQNDDTRAQDLIDGLSDTVPRAYQKPWDKGHHLANATDDFTDALWAVGEGKRTVSK